MEHKPSAFIPASLLTWGSLAIRGQPVLVAGARCTLEVEATLATALPAGYSIEVWTHFVSDIERPQCTHPMAPAHVGCSSSGPVVQTFVHAGAAVHGPNTFFPYRRYAGFRLVEAAAAGSRFVVRLQDVSMQTYEEPLFNLRFAILKDEHQLVGYLGDACYEVIGGVMQFLRVVAPTCVEVGEPFRCHVVVCDRYRNKTGEPIEALRFDVRVDCETGAPDGLGFDTIAYDPDRRLYTVDGIRCAAPGAYYLHVTLRDAPHIAGTSNPVVVRERWAEKVYWGDLHQHSYHDDGRGLPAANYAYARSTSCLDFCAVTPHQERAIAPALHHLAGPVQRGWDELIDAAEECHDADLVTILGSEASSLGRLAGHMNAYYLDHHNRPEFERLGWDPATMPRPPIESYAQYLAVLESSRGEVLLLPHAHAGGSPGKFPLPKRPEYQTNVEVCSVHGVFEEFYRQWLRHGHVVGVHGSGDNHMTSTGNANPGYHYPNTNGLAAVFAPEKTRPAIWRGLKNRRTYAVTAHQRIFVELTIDGTPMGGVVAGPAARRAIHLVVAGTAPLLKAELFRGDDVVHTYRPRLAGRRYLRVTWTDSFGSRRVDDSSTTGRITLPGRRLRLVSVLNAYTRTDEFAEEAGTVRFRSNGYSGITRGVLLEAIGAGADTAEALRFEIVDRHLGQTLLQTHADVPLDKAPIHLDWPLDVDPALPRWRLFGDEPQLPAFTLDVEWIDPAWPRVIAVDWEDDADLDAYYYVRLEQIDGAIAWSSPIWIERDR